MEDRPTPWYVLSQGQKRPYEYQAEYLIERGYITDKTIAEVAKALYEKELDN